jgi:hypothetical protein
MRKVKKTKTVLKILLMIALLPSIMVFILPKDFSTWWWNIIVVITFLSGLLFCAFVDSNWIKNQIYISKFKLFKKKIEIYNLGSLIFAPIPILFLFESKHLLSNANTLILLTLLIIMFKIFKIRILD